MLKDFFPCFITFLRATCLTLRPSRPRALASHFRPSGSQDGVCVTAPLLWSCAMAKGHEKGVINAKCTTKSERLHCRQDEIFVPKLNPFNIREKVEIRKEKTTCPSNLSAGCRAKVAGKIREIKNKFWQIILRLTRTELGASPGSGGWHSFFGPQLFGACQQIDTHTKSPAGRGFGMAFVAWGFATSGVLYRERGECQKILL